MKVSLVILTHNSEELIEGCLKSAQWADELIIFDDNSSDSTVSIAKKYTDKIYTHKLQSFPDQRTKAAQKVSTDWFMFLDVDERISASLQQEIIHTIANTSFTAFRFKRQNYFFAKKIRHGGYWPDWQTRLFKTKTFKQVTGDTHENFIFSGELGSLHNHLIHFTHKNLLEGLPKSATFTQKEASAFVAAGHPRITPLRIIKVMVWEFCYRYFKKFGFRDGYVGFTEAVIQAINKYFIYQQIWEMQQQPPLKAQYKFLEESEL